MKTFNPLANDGIIKRFERLKSPGGRIGRRIPIKIGAFERIARQGKIIFKVLIRIAQVAELVDAADSKSAVRKDVLVRFQSWAQSLSEMRGFPVFIQ